MPASNYDDPPVERALFPAPPPPCLRQGTLSEPSHPGPGHAQTGGSAVPRLLDSLGMKHDITLIFRSPDNMDLPGIEPGSRNSFDQILRAYRVSPRWFSGCRSSIYPETGRRRPVFGSLLCCAFRLPEHLTGRHPCCYYAAARNSGATAPIIHAGSSTLSLAFEFWSAFYKAC